MGTVSFNFTPAIDPSCGAQTAALPRVSDSLNGLGL